MPPPTTINEATAAVTRERGRYFNCDIIPSAHLRAIVDLLYDEVIRQRGYIEQLHAQADAQ